MRAVHLTKSNGRSTMKYKKIVRNYYGSLLIMCKSIEFFRNMDNKGKYLQV
jgi:hypothetical protein